MTEDPQEIRLLRYHLSSGHVLCEAIGEELSDISDDEILQRLTVAVWGTPTVLGTRVGGTAVVLLTEAQTESRMLLAVDKIEFIQVARATRLHSPEDLEAAADAEDSAIARAKKLWSIYDPERKQGDPS